MHVIVATDGSQQSLRAARHLKSFADPSKIEEISVIAVIRPLAAVAFADDLSPAERRKADLESGGFRKAAACAGGAGRAPPPCVQGGTALLPMDGVAEGGGARMIEDTLDIATAEGAMETFLCRPERGGPAPAVLMLMDAPGVREELLLMGKPWNSPPIRLAAPRPTISWLGSTRWPLRTAIPSGARWA